MQKKKQIKKLLRFHSENLFLEAVIRQFLNNKTNSSLIVNIIIYFYTIIIYIYIQNYYILCVLQMIQSSICTNPIAHYGGHKISRSFVWHAHIDKSFLIVRETLQNMNDIGLGTLNLWHGNIDANEKIRTRRVVNLDSQRISHFRQDNYFNCIRLTTSLHPRPCFRFRPFVPFTSDAPSEIPRFFVRVYAFNYAKSEKCS